MAIVWFGQLYISGELAEMWGERHIQTEGEGKEKERGREKGRKRGRKEEKRETKEEGERGRREELKYINRSK